MKQIETDNIFQGKNKENPFRMPDGYYEHLVDSLHNRIHNKEQVVSGSHTLFVMPRLIYAIAAVSVIILIVSGIFFFNSQGTVKEYDDIAMLIKEDIDSYDEAMLVDAILAEEEPIDASFNEMSNYLIETENIEIETIVEEL